MPIIVGATPSKLRLVSEHHSEAHEETPLLSIVVCAYRHAQYIEKCLMSINQSSAKDIEILIIDDDSPDETLDRCINFAFRADISVRIFTKPNYGLVDSLRYGLQLARGRYVAFMASDDFYNDIGFESILEILRSDSSKADVLLCQAIYIGGAFENRPVYGSETQRFFDKTARERVDLICTEFPKPMLLQSTIFDKQFLISINPWSDTIELDDWPTFIRVFISEAAEEAVVEYFPDIALCYYRLHDGGIHNQTDRMLRVTEQVAMHLVPTRYRATCLANVRVDCSLIHLFEGRWRKGLILLYLGLRTSISSKVIARPLSRAGKYIFSAAKNYFARLKIIIL
jgi:glycosyltransferase involved in cell wall biosynthesis